MLRTTLLVGAMTGPIMGIAQYFGGSQGLTIAFIVAVVMNFGSYWFSDKIVLKMYGGQQVSEADASQLYRIVHALTVRAGLPKPKLYIIPSQGANAFATGRNPENAAVAVTEGMLRLMNERELTGVLAHELAHAKNRDILISSIAATLAGVIMMVANMAQWAATIIQMAISRTREYAADKARAQMSGDPAGLASPLEKLGLASEQIPMGASP